MSCPTVKVTMPGPQGPAGAGLSVENPGGALYLVCEDDGAVIEVKIRLDQGIYTLEVGQVDVSA